MKSGRTLHAIGAVVTGATHLRNNQPCQDAVHTESDGVFAIAAVADGHGSDKCPHSADGARVAVRIAADFLRENISHMPLLERELWLPKQVEQQWKAAIREEFANENYIQYGCTLLAAAVTKDYAFALAIGDGDLLMVDAKGEVHALLTRGADANIGEDTESLCLENAWQHIRTLFLPLNPRKAAPLFMLSTDGYANSFAGSAGFAKAGADFRTMWQEDGPDFIAENLPAWLSATTERGSGDDIALALAGRKSDRLIEVA